MNVYTDVFASLNGTVECESSIGVKMFITEVYLPITYGSVFDGIRRTRCIHNISPNSIL